MAGDIKTTAFGFDAEKRLRAAVGRVIKDVQAQTCNCLEITDVATKSFLGVPYTSISAHARHIQNGSQFNGDCGIMARGVENSGAFPVVEEAV